MSWFNERIYKKSTYKSGTALMDYILLNNVCMLNNELNKLS